MPQRSALVTGAAGGLGLATARRLARDGMRVHLADRLPEVTQQAREITAWAGEPATGHIVDLASEDQTVALAGGLDAVDVLVNNAGIHPKLDGAAVPITAMSAAAWNEMIAVNLTAPFLLCRALAPRMTARGWGRIVNMSSRAGRTLSPQASTCYAATKAGLLGFSRSLAAELAAHQVTVNCVAPGPISTPLAGSNAPERRQLLLRSVPLGRHGTPDEVAAAVAFLVSDEAAYLTGAVLDVNGGSFMP